MLDELKNDITRETPASFEPSIDYVVTKIPRFACEKLPPAGACRAAPHAHHAVKAAAELGHVVISISPRVPPSPHSGAT